jgi:putative DNA methylase
MRSLIEVQFPINQLSLESYIERDAKSAKVLASLGKWWGAKPLVLIRAIILGSVFPASKDYRDWPRDLEIFLKCLTMDNDGMWRRKTKNLPATICFQYANSREREELFVRADRWKPISQFSSQEDKKRYRKHKSALEKRTFFSLDYVQQREFCCRVEEIDGPSDLSWQEINDYLNTFASTLAELVQELSIRFFGTKLKVGDVFSGIGYIPFVAAELGCDIYASDLNPVAGLLSWGALNVIGGNKAFHQLIQNTQERIYDQLDSYYKESKLESSEEGWRAEAYLYCIEIEVPDWDNWRIPICPNWMVAPKPKTWVELIPQLSEKKFTFKVNYGGEGYKKAKQGTKQGADIICPEVLWKLFQKKGAHKNKTKILNFKSILDQTRGLRKWDREDFMSRSDDFFQERLFCIRWRQPDWIDDRGNARNGDLIYREPTKYDLEKEQEVIDRLREVFADWQEKGWIPHWRIQPGKKTNEPIRTRGWTYWHHLFNPRQLLMAGYYSKLISQCEPDIHKALLFNFGRLLDMNSKLCRWLGTQGGGIGGTKSTFYNQALNTFPNYASRGLTGLIAQLQPNHKIFPLNCEKIISVNDARDVSEHCHLWITDPPYADAVNYEELSEFFLAWYAPHLKTVEPDWYTDSMRDRAIKGSDVLFREAMADSYRRLAENMPEDGIQVCMFTHKNTEVWEDLALIMWAAGLQVKQVWSIATETPGAGIRVGNYVQATYNMVLRKRKENKIGYTDFITPQLKRRVREVIDNMRQSQIQGDLAKCGYTDTDYILAAQAAAVEVITGFAAIDGTDLEEELRKPNSERQNSVLKQFMATAKETATDFLVPSLLDRIIKDNHYSQESTVFWRGLTQEEKFLFKSLEMESQDVCKIGVFQDLGRSYGLPNYESLILTARANACRTRLPEELPRANALKFKEIPPDERDLFEHSITRHIYQALKYIREGANMERAARHVVDCTDFWREKNGKIKIILDFLHKATQNIPAWEDYRNDLSSLKLNLEHWRA